MQQCRKPCPLIPPGCLVHPHEVWRQSTPALCPDLGLALQAPSGPTPSLGTPRFLRRRHRYYRSVRRPISAQWSTPVCPRASPPSVTTPTVPIGPPGSRRWLFVREAACDPGGASPSRLATAHMRPSATGTASASTTFHPFGALCPHPTRPLSTLRTVCRHTARKTRSQPARYGVGRAGLPPAGHLQFAQRTPA
jgi:hypothetical protein